MLETHLFDRTSLRKLSHRITSIVPISLCHFTHVSVHFVHFNDMKINRWYIYYYSMYINYIKTSSFSMWVQTFSNAKIVTCNFLIWLWLWFDHENSHSFREKNYFLILLPRRSSLFQPIPFVFIGRKEE